MRERLSTDEHIHKIDGVRSMSAEILVESAEILQIDLKGMENVLIPRIQKFAQENLSNNYEPAGASLTTENELGVNLFLNAINFCYKDPANGNEYKYVNYTGKTIKRSTGLYTAMVESGVEWSDFEKVKSITDEQWKQTLQLSDTNTMFLGKERLRYVTRLAAEVINAGAINISQFLELNRYDAVNIAINLSKGGVFDDEFLKRAQLAPRVINDVLVRRTDVPLINLDYLTVMADYRLPQVLYNLGAVRLNCPDLVDKLFSWTPIEAKSVEEKALRASAIFAGYKISRKLGIAEADVDTLLWTLSQEMEKNGEMSIPHMIVATDAY